MYPTSEAFGTGRIRQKRKVFIRGASPQRRIPPESRSTQSASVRSAKFLSEAHPLKGASHQRVVRHRAHPLEAQSFCQRRIRGVSPQTSLNTYSLQGASVRDPVYSSKAYPFKHLLETHPIKRHILSEVVYKDVASRSRALCFIKHVLSSDFSNKTGISYITYIAIYAPL